MVFQGDDLLVVRPFELASGKIVRQGTEYPVVRPTGNAGYSTMHFTFDDADKSPIISGLYRQSLMAYAARSTFSPLFLEGDALTVLKDFSDSCIDCAMTSPPYWGKREYENGGIGLEGDYRDYIQRLSAIFLELRRVLKTQGSFWLNIGDSYRDKGLVGLP